MVIPDSSRLRLLRLARGVQGNLPVWFGPLEWSPTMFVAAFERWARLYWLRMMRGLPVLEINAREPVATGDTRFPR
jgi:hypothetical protein